MEPQELGIISDTVLQIKETEVQRGSVTCPADTTKEHQSQGYPRLQSGFSLQALHHTRSPLLVQLKLKSYWPHRMEQPGEVVYTPFLLKVNSHVTFSFFL